MKDNNEFNIIQHKEILPDGTERYTIKTIRKIPPEGGIYVKWWYVIVFIGLIIFIFMGYRTVIRTPFSGNGNIFSESSIRKLSDNEIETLKSQSYQYIMFSYEDLLDFSINEIYARHGYIFEQNGKYDKFYKKYEWYQKTTKKNNVEWNEFNAAEKYNINKLVEVAEKNGFR